MEISKIETMGKFVSGFRKRILFRLIFLMFLSFNLPILISAAYADHSSGTQMQSSLGESGRTMWLAIDSGILLMLLMLGVGLALLLKRRSKRII